jgi:hypothetical protein
MWAIRAQDRYWPDLEKVMRFQLYLAIGGEQFDANLFQQSAGSPNSRVKRIGTRGHQIDPARFSVWDIWESERINGSNEPGDDVDALLAANSKAISLLKDPRWAAAARWVGIVGHYLDDDGPRGFSFDENTIKAVAAIGGSIKIDMVVDGEEILKHLPSKAP